MYRVHRRQYRLHYPKIELHYPSIEHLGTHRVRIEGGLFF
uniref:Uncharacterized protein n=1 Tax=Arundo donax TaxID=35708 RepID=A0A0A9GQU8_ARUDO